MAFLLLYSIFAARLAGVLAQAGSQSNATLLADLGAAYEAKQHADNSFSFYESPANFSASLDPGTLLHVEDSTVLLNYTVPISLTMSRIIYTTSDINGTTLPTSAYILWPYTPPSPETGYPLVAWAHGTSGVFKPCAPSNYRSLQYHFMVPYTLALQGMAVVAPDYAGLGIDSFPSGEQFHHQWVAAPAQANDLANAIMAARTAFPQLLPSKGPFVAMGHSQGGRASWSFAQRQSSQPLEGYRGTVALSPPTRFIEQIQQAANNPLAVYSPGTLSYQPMIIDAISTVFPSYNYSGLTAAAYDRWFDVLAKVQGCLPTDVLAFSDLPPNQLVHPGWTNDLTVQQWANLTDVGNKRFAGPLLVLIGSEDSVVNAKLVKKTVEETCDLSQKEKWREGIEFVEYSAVSHFAAIQASQEKWLHWVKARLQGDAIEKEQVCSVSKVDGFRTVPNPQGAAPNFLVEWVNPVKDFWKYVL